jgi:hypothetical protein
MSFAAKATDSEMGAQCTRVISDLNLLGKGRVRSKWNGISKPRLFSFLGFAAPVLLWTAFFWLVARADIDDRLSKAERDVNRASPKMLDEETRLDGAKAGPGRRFTYRYTLLSRKSEIDRSTWENTAAPAIRGRIKQARELRSLFEDGVTLVYRYDTLDGQFFDEIVVTPAEASSSL